MSTNDITTQAIRLAMRLSQAQVEIAGQNIARASTPGSRAAQVDFSLSQGLLERAVGSPADAASGLSEILSQAASHAPSTHLADGVQLDEQVADMSAATLKYQALTESLNRHFGLMRLAIGGRN